MNKKTYLVKVAYLMDLSDEEYQEIGDNLIPELENEMTVRQHLKLKWDTGFRNNELRKVLQM
ncbi:hypothetical protein ABIE27_003710 [Paenibacillus sp. 4624]|uniref:hypothetical protein n=1 Tax=Paenibacillus sp. 4624 TaxID=3156453 RepID=UPI003D2366F9